MTNHTRTFRIRNNSSDRDAPRVVDVDATPEQIAALERDGYIVRERLVSGDLLETLRHAADELEADALAKQKPGEGKGFGGLFLRGLIDKHRVFRDVLLILRRACRWRGRWWGRRCRFMPASCASPTRNWRIRTWNGTFISASFPTRSRRGFIVPSSWTI